MVIHKKATTTVTYLRSYGLNQSTEATLILIRGQGFLALAADDVAHAAMLASAGVTPDGVLLVLVVGVVPGGRGLVRLGSLLCLLGKENFLI